MHRGQKGPLVTCFARYKKWGWPPILCPRNVCNWFVWEIEYFLLIWNRWSYYFNVSRTRFDCYPWFECIVLFRLRKLWYKTNSWWEVSKLMWLMIFLERRPNTDKYFVSKLNKKSIASNFNIDFNLDFSSCKELDSEIRNFMLQHVFYDKFVYDKWVLKIALLRIFMWLAFVTLNRKIPSLCCRPK